MPKASSEHRKKFKTPRSKSGCITCRIRRVKCDEAKPACVRCTKFGFKCDGYLDRPIPNKSHRRLLKPRVFETPVLRTSPVSADLKFQNQTEYQYFKAFETAVVPHLTGAIESPVWKQIILQSAASESFVRDAVLGIAALHISFNDSLTKPESIARNNAYAFQRFGKALSSMRLAISTGRLGVRKTLIGCLLVFCFEALQGNMAAAISHARWGYKLLHSPDGVHETNSLSDAVEESLVQALNRLDLQVITVTNPKPSSVPWGAEKEDSQDIEPIPTTFASFDEAYRSWCLVMREAAKFILKAVTAAVSNPSSPKQELTDEPTTPASPVVACASQFQIPSPEDAVPQALRQQQAIYVKKVSDWQEAFRPFRWNPTFTMEPGAIGMYTHSLSTQILLDSTLHTNECTIDTFFSEFRTILYLSKSFFKHNTPSIFSVDFGILPGLFLVATMCRDRSVRREAIQVLRCHPRREGLWDSRLIAEVGTWVADLEEARATETGFIPEQARVRITRIEVDTTTKTVKLVGTRKSSTASRSLDFEHATIFWG